MPLMPKIKESELNTSNFEILLGIIFSKFFTTDNFRNKSFADNSEFETMLLSSIVLILFSNFLDPFSNQAEPRIL